MHWQRVFQHWKRGVDNMDNILVSIMEQLSRISVHGDDVERMCAVKHMIRQLQSAYSEAKAEQEQKTE